MNFFVGLCYFAGAAVIALYAYFVFNYQYWKKRKIPHLEPRIPYGTLYRSGNRTEHAIESIAETYQAFKGKTPLAGMYFFLTPIPLVIDLDLTQQILIKDFKMFHDRGIYYNYKYDPLTINLFFARGAQWRRLRTKMTPTFTSGKMKFMFSTVVDVAKRFNDTFSECLEMDNVIEIKELLARFTTDVIGSCAFGIECNSLKDPNAEFRTIGRRFFARPPLSNFMRLFVNKFPKLSIELGIKTIESDVSKFFLRIVRETVEYREKNNIRRNDFMDLLIQLKNAPEDKDRFSLEEVAAQAFLFFLAGFETSSTTMTFALYELAMNPEVQEKARHEIVEVLKKHDDELTYEAMMDMHYLDCLINETLRKHPPVFVLFRVAAEDYPVPGTDKVIPKGSRVFIPSHCIHRDPDIFPDPDVFDPSRFEPEEVKKRHPMSFLGFGDGPRNCIGARFGQMQAKIGLITLLKNFRFEPCEQTLNPMRYQPNVVILTPDGGMYLKVERVSN